MKFRPQIERGEYKVFTANGKPARIVAWDFKSNFNEPIYALITNPEGNEYGCSFDKYGQYVGNKENYLVIEDGSENTRWEERVREILENTPSLAETAAALLDAARHEIDLRMLDAIHTGVTVKTNSGPDREYYGL